MTTSRVHGSHGTNPKNHGLLETWSPNRWNSRASDVAVRAEKRGAPQPHPPWRPTVLRYLHSPLDMTRGWRPIPTQTVSHPGCCICFMDRVCYCRTRSTCVRTVVRFCNMRGTTNSINARPLRREIHLGSINRGATSRVRWQVREDMAPARSEVFIPPRAQ
jgi:hypothetical protein